ncbi:MAG: histidine--tRNA ligase [Gammaproteobacteria bacterium]|nr:histidine--tRNA ligase [Gammaproteobacteria bacterium]
MSKRIEAIRGMNDVLPADIPAWHRLEAVAREAMAVYGYSEIRLPIVEQTALFERSVGEATDIVEKEMYTFTDRGGDSLTLRPEGTASCVRAGISNGLLHNQRQRLWYSGPMFRYERPQKGRYRQFYQIGAEAFGFEGPWLDVELLLLSRRIFNGLGIRNLRLQVNSLGSPETRRRYREALVDYFSSAHEQLDEESQRRLKRNPMRILDSKNPDMAELIAGAPEILSYLDDASAAHFAGLREGLDAAGVEFTVNSRLVRGLDYYTHTVFEWLTDELGSQGAVCAGGRYDGLVEELGGKATPGVGWSMGIERLVALMQSQGSAPDAPPPHAFLIAVGRPAAIEMLKLAEKLRDAVPGLRLSGQAGEGSLKSQLKGADRSDAGVALIIGKDELADGRVAYKPLRSNEEQVLLTSDEVTGRLAALSG